jgi:hypothetical protein
MHHAMEHIVVARRIRQLEIEREALLRELA